MAGSVLARPGLLLHTAVASDRPGRERLLTVTHDALAGVQAAVLATSGSGWPDPTPGADPPQPHAEISGDAVNPLLRLWCGPSEAPVAELTPPILVNMVLYDGPDAVALSGRPGGARVDRF